MIEAETLAAELYDGHPAAEPLLVESISGATDERRRRSAVALLALDPDHSMAVVSAMASAVTRAWADVSSSGDESREQSPLLPWWTR